MPDIVHTWETFYGARILFNTRHNLTFLQRAIYTEGVEGRPFVTEGDRRILEAARMSYNADQNGMTTPARDESLVRFMRANQHTSPFQHVMYTFTLEIPVFVKSQAERHRTFDFTYWQINEQSRRFTSKDVELARHDILWRKQNTEGNKQGSHGGVPQKLNYEIEERVGAAYKVVMDTYHWMVENGVALEQARQIIPQSMMCDILCTVDLWNLLHFVMLRCDPHAQEEIRVLAYIIKNKMIPMMNPWVSKLITEEFIKRGWEQNDE